MSELKAELDLLANASNKWRDEVSNELSETATSIEDLKYSSLQFGLFLGAWQSYTAAAEYMQNRLKEGATATEQIADALRDVVANYREQESLNADQYDVTRHKLESIN